VGLVVGVGVGDGGVFLNLWCIVFGYLALDFELCLLLWGLGFRFIILQGRSFNLSLCMGDVVRQTDLKKFLAAVKPVPFHDIFNLVRFFVARGGDFHAYLVSPCLEE
jgi:hypothetical protein